jgi:hypothetical protein
MNSAHESDFCSDLSRSIAIQRPMFCRRCGHLYLLELGPRFVYRDGWIWKKKN